MPGYCDQETKEGEYSMQQPFWKLNLGLLLVVSTLLAAMFFYKIDLRRPVSIIPSEISEQGAIKKTGPIDIAKIYQNDLFNTHISKEAPSEKTVETKPVPPPPQPVTVPPPPVETPKFLDPLPITLTGVFMLNDEAKNRVIIANNKTKEETTYKIGDEIEDAQIIAIFPEKVMLVRSNGQQEMVYLRQDTATAEAHKLIQKDWNRVAKKIESNNFVIDLQEFISEIGTISNFVDMFNLATAYKEGKSIGIKIGKLENSSLANILGFLPGDIVTAINNLSVKTTDERLCAYSEIAKLKKNALITVEFLRKQQPLTINIKIDSIVPQYVSITKTPIKPSQEKVDQEEKERQVELLRQKEKFAPTLRDIQRQEKQNIIRHRRMAGTRNHSNKD